MLAWITIEEPSVSVPLHTFEEVDSGMELVSLCRRPTKFQSSTAISKYLSNNPCILVRGYITKQQQTFIVQNELDKKLGITLMEGMLSELIVAFQVSSYVDLSSNFIALRILNEYKTILHAENYK